MRSVRAYKVNPAEHILTVSIADTDEVFLLHIGETEMNALMGEPGSYATGYHLNVALIEALGAALDRIVLHDFKEGLIHATLVIVREGVFDEDPIEVGVGPGYALTLATLARVPAY
ncbi:MAG: bifunctional nuclease family protein, partial [Candidatus Spechtbacteria bacterium]|nr:bifunctional nuclease family protein [Candidatus Spechtbacteria bacterium]